MGASISAVPLEAENEGGQTSQEGGNGQGGKLKDAGDKGGTEDWQYYESLPLDEKRKLYKCKLRFVTLDGIKPWADTRKPISFKNPPPAAFSPAPSLDAKVFLWHGDITCLEIDAIVSSANLSLLGGGGGGIDDVIHAAAGPWLFEECRALNGCRAGQAKITSGHALPAKYILHTVGPYDRSREVLERCYTSCFSLAVENNIRSLAFCCIATGIHGYPNDEAAEVALSVTRKWLEENADKIDRIIFCVFLERDLEIYYRKLNHFFPPEGSQSSDEENPATYTASDDVDRVCSDSQLQKELLDYQQGVKTMEKQVDIFRVEAENERKRSSLLQVEIKNLKWALQEIGAKDDQIAARDGVIRERDAEIMAMERTIRRAREQIADLQLKVDATKGKERFMDIQSLPGNSHSWNVPRALVEGIAKCDIGRGAWGVVYSGTFQGQCVAIKYAHKEILHGTTIDMLKREVMIMAEIQHPNLVRFIAAVFDDAVDRGTDTPIVVSELMEMNLREAYRKVDLSSNLISIFCDVAYALHYLHHHHQPIVHRDISAPNVLLKTLRNGTYQAKVSDFGSANLVKQARTAATGSIIYCAPEMFPSEDITVRPKPQTTKVDVFSYGILMLEVIVKEMPTHETRYTMLQQVRNRWILMHELIVHCTKPSPSERPAMADILNKLNRLPH